MASLWRLSLGEPAGRKAAKYVAYALLVRYFAPIAFVPGHNHPDHGAGYESQYRRQQNWLPQCHNAHIDPSNCVPTPVAE